MKKLFVILSFLACFAISDKLTAQVYSLNTVDIDTLTNADTVLNTVTGRPYPFEYEVHINITSISGTALDTIYIEQAARGTTDWIVKDSHPVGTNTSTHTAIKSGFCMGGDLRIRSKSTGTQSTRVKTSTQIYKSIPQN